MKILVLDETGYVGVEIANAARRSDHQVELISDMAQVPARLQQADERWDTAVCSHHACAVGDDSLLKLLRAKSGRVILVSSLTERFELPGDAHAEFGRDTSVIHAGFVLAPSDPMQRLGYWLERIARGGEVLAPGAWARNVPWCDLRDLAEFVRTLIESGRAGVHSAADGRERLTMQAFLEACRTVCNADATFTWVSDDFLHRHGVGGRAMIPLWLSSERTQRWASSIEPRGSALPERTIAETVLFASGKIGSGNPAPPAHVIGSDREEEILHAWHQLSMPYRGPSY